MTRFLQDKYIVQVYNYSNELKYESGNLDKLPPFLKYERYKDLLHIYPEYHEAIAEVHRNYEKNKVVDYSPIKEFIKLRKDHRKELSTFAKFIFSY